MGNIDRDPAYLESLDEGGGGGDKFHQSQIVQAFDCESTGKSSELERDVITVENSVEVV